MAWRERLAFFSAALWWGSLSAVGFWVVPLLFASLPTANLAGGMAARLFAAQTWVALGCGIVLLACSKGREGGLARTDWAGGALGFVVGALLLAMLSEFAVAPRIIARENLQLWHSVGTAMFALQWVAVGVVLWKLTGRRPA